MGYIKNNEYVMNTCKPGQMEKTCRYLMMGPKGWECGKTDPKTKLMFDQKVASMSAKADNCPGVK